MTDRRVVAALACRNAGSRLYGKPLQNLDIERGTTILDNIVGCLRSLPFIDDIVLGIAEGIGNDVFADYAVRNGLAYIMGDETDVLGRLVACADKVGATDVFRVTSESPFLYYDAAGDAWNRYVREGAGALFLDDIVDGCGFEILSAEALRMSHRDGEDRHRSELCSLYIRENHDQFATIKLAAPDALHRLDLRLTVDNPEDLVICRHIYKVFRQDAPRISVPDIIRFLDTHPNLIALTAPFALQGYETMYVWGKEKPAD